MRGNVRLILWGFISEIQRDGLILDNLFPVDWVKWWFSKILPGAQCIRKAIITCCQKERNSSGIRDVRWGKEKKTTT